MRRLSFREAPDTGLLSFRGWSACALAASYSVGAATARKFQRGLQTQGESAS